MRVATMGESTFPVSNKYSALLSKLSVDSVRSMKINSNGLWWSFFALWAVVVGLLWCAEEPSKFNTIVVVFTVFTIAIIIIKQAKRGGIIESEIKWMFSFMLMITLVALVSQYSWFMGDVSGGDFGRYDFAARLIVNNNMDFSLIARGGEYIDRLDLGIYVAIVYYIACIYWFFGISTFYVSLWNSLFVLIAYLSIMGILVDRTGETSPWQNMRWGLLLPTVLFLTSVPGKDVLVMFFIAIAIFAISRLLLRQNIKSYIILIVSFLGLSVFRTTVVVFVLLMVLIFLLHARKRKRIYLTFLLTAMMLLFVYIAPKVMAFFTGGVKPSISRMFGTKFKIQQAEKHSSETSLNLMFTPRNPIQLIMFAPIRAIFLLVAPFPRLWFYTGVGEKINYYALSVWIILLFFPALIAATLQKACRRQEVYWFVVIPFWAMLTAISLGNYVMTERYRLMVIPFWVATILVGSYYGKPKKYVLPSVALVFIGLSLYYLLKYISV